MALALILTFLERYHKGDETWVSFVNAETKEQSRQWIQKTSQESLNKHLPPES
jgi:hypothetical protein